MASDLETLQSIRSQTLARIAELTVSPKPTYDVDGQKVAWSEYLDMLRRTVDWCEAKLAGEEPFEMESRGIS